MRQEAGVWPSCLVRWLVDFVRSVVGSNPGRGYDRDSHFVCPLARVLKSRQPQSVPTMPTSLWLNLVSDHPLVQWDITRDVSQEISLPRKGLFKWVDPWASRWCILAQVSDHIWVC